MIGKTLGHYQITNQLSKGGMGEAFQAKDQVLGREVAIKVLPEEFARDTDRVARFQREAKVLASLNHPNIASIHGLEESGGTKFLVLELVEGNTLADRIKAGPMPVEESLKLALQIAEPRVRRLCLQCREKLTLRQKRFCYDDCRKIWKREDMRKRRGFSPHRHVCQICGKTFNLGRPPLAEICPHKVCDGSESL